MSYDSEPPGQQDMQWGAVSVPPQNMPDERQAITATRRMKFSGSDRPIVIEEPIHETSQRHEVVGSDFRALAKRLCEEHPDISVDERIFGGLPHINGVRLSVSDVLGQLSMLHNTKAVAERFSPYVSEVQVQEALVYAQKLLKRAYHWHETDD